MRKIAQILWNTGVGFYEDGLSQRAAALTYFTLMSIVPVLAVALGLARGFGAASILEGIVQQQLHEQPDIAKYIIDFAYKLLEQTSSGVIAGIGIILLLWSVYNILGNIEESFNHIWKIPNPRSWIRKITDYISTIFICPIFFIIASSATIYIKTHFVGEIKSFEFLQSFFLQLLPYFVIWMLFTFLYFFLPNKRIPFKYGIIGVLVAGTAYQLLQAFYITIQIKLSSYGTVYGSFAALPLFLIWLNLSWMIILVGAELAHQLEIASWNNVPKNEEYLKTTTSSRVLALLVVHEIIEVFREGKPPLTLESLSEKLGASKNNLDATLKILVYYKIISEIYDFNGDIYYQPAKDINRLSLKSVADIFPYVDSERVTVMKNPQLDYFTGALNKYDLDSYKSSSNVSLG